MYMFPVVALIVSTLYFSLIPIAHASAPYYEFNPDYAQSLLVSSDATSVEELFIPINEYLAGVDLWLSTGEVEGNITVSLLRNGTQLTTKTIALPAIADSEEGTRTYIGFPTQISVSSSATYTLRITSTSPTLRLYWGEQNTLIAHNGKTDPSFAGGRARIDGEDRNFSFKFALYETTESAPPVLSNVSIQQSTTGQASIHFFANEPVDASVTYGNIAIPYSSTYSSCVSGLVPCSIFLPVQPGASYTYVLTARDIWGNASTATGQFTALGSTTTPSPTPDTNQSTPTPSPITTTPSPTPDTTKPVITNARSSLSTPTSLSLAWTTSKASNGTVVVQLTPVLITVGGNSDPTLELEHLVTVGGLTPDTYYAVRITSTDTWGNVASTSLTVLTPRQAAQPVPAETSQPQASTTAPPTTPTPAPINASGNAGSTNVTWTATTQPPDQYRVDVFDSQNHLIKSVAVPKGKTSIQVEGLAEGDHRIVVYAQHDGVYEKVSAPATTHVRAISLAERLAHNAPAILGSILALVVLTIGGLKLRSRRNPATAGPAPVVPQPIPAPQTPPIQTPTQPPSVETPPQTDSSQHS
jgi:hypothetical protein